MPAIPALFCNFHWIVPGEAARAAQIHAALLGPFLAAHDIKAVINLRGRHPEFGWWRRETAACRNSGVAHFDAMLDSRLLPTRHMLVALLEALAAAPRPLLIKCSGGQDRTSLAAALYLLQQNGWRAKDDARRQFSRFPFLHFPKKHQRWLRHLLCYLEENLDGAALDAGAARRYDPAAFAAWLDGQKLRHAYRALYPG